MKEKEAYRCVLSIILGEPDLELADVKVERVVLNKSGKRAIRLDAWAMDYKDRQFAVEMQNSSTEDFMPKRARFYHYPNFDKIKTYIIKRDLATLY